MRYRLQAILFVFIAFMLGCNEYIIVGVLPDVASEFKTSLSSLGILVTLFAFVYALATPLVTSFCNRFLRHKALIFLVVIFFIGNTWTALSTNYISLLLSRLLTASVVGTIISLVLVIANYIAPREKRASLVSWVFAGFSLASVVGIPIGTLISTTFSWHDSFWMISGITLVALILLFWLVPKDTPQYKSTFKHQFTILREKQVILGVLFVVAICATDYTIYTYIRPLFTNVMGFNNTWLNWLLFGMGIFFILGNKFGGYLADNGGVNSLRYIYLCMTILTLIFGVALNYPFLGTIVIALLCISFASYGATTQIMFIDIAEKKYPQALDLASSLNSIFANIGISLGSLTASQVVNFTSMKNLGYVASIYALIAFILIFWLAKLNAKERLA